VLGKAQFDFNSMFNETWLRNDEFFFIFNQFYDGLNDFYGEYQSNLRDLIRKLFIDLTRLFYNVFNTQASVRIDDTCLESNFDSLNSFDSGGLHSVMNRLVACLESIKVLNSGLTRVRDLLIELYAKYESPSESCLRSMTQMSSCSMCMANFKPETTRPCMDSCVNAYKKCVNVDFAQLDLLWKSYIGTNLQNFYTKSIH
jgi:hypothetical protein